MPEWVTHVLIGLVLAELLFIPKRSVVLLGAILPDLFAKLVLLRLFIPIPHWNYSFLSMAHTPFVLFLVCLLLAPLFRYEYRKIVYWLMVGGLSHIFSDMLLKHYLGGGMALLFPFSNMKFSLGLFWPDESYLLLYIMILIYLCILFFKYERKKGLRAADIGGEGI